MRNPRNRFWLVGALVSLCVLVVVCCVSVSKLGHDASLVPVHNEELQERANAGSDVDAVAWDNSGDASSGAFREGDLVGDRAYEEGSVIVSIANGVTADQLNERLAKLDYVAGAKVDEADVEYGFVELKLAEGVSVEEALRQFETEPLVDGAQPNYIYQLQESSASDAAYAQNDLQAASIGDSLFTQTTSINDSEASRLWGLDAVHAYEAWDYYRAQYAETNNRPVTVAVIDSGLNTGHEDFESTRIVGARNYVGYESYSVANFDAKGSYDSNVADGKGHGTHVAGIIAATANNGIGVAGVSYNARIMPVKVCDSEGNTNTTKVAKALKYIIKYKDEYKVRVINISIGTTSDGPLSDTEFQSAVQDAHDAGLLIVYAAGNGGASGPYNCIPCDFDDAAGAIGVIAVEPSSASSGATTYVRASYSNYNKSGQTTKDISAPGGTTTGAEANKIYSTYISNSSSYNYQSGTSMAAPYVSGIAALLFAAKPSMTAAQVEATLEDTATDLGSAGWDRLYGNGLVNAAAALESAAPELAVAISGDDKIQVGESTEYSISNSSGDWSWSSSNEAVAKITGGRVVGVGAGSADITATNGNSSLSQVVNVYDPAIIGDNVVPVGTAMQLAVSPDNPDDSWVWDTLDSSVVQILDSSSGKIYGKALGVATVTVSLASDPDIKASLEVTVGTNDIANASVSGISDQVYTGNPLTFDDLVVRMYSTVGTSTGYTQLIKGTDYEVAYDNNTNIGTATVTITGKGGYTGTYTDTFRITRYSFDDATVAKVNSSSATYTGSAIKPGVTIEVGGRTLQESTDGGQTGDYTVSYSNNVNVGKAGVVVYGINDYSGTLSGGFAITAVPITSSDIVVSGVTPKTYTGSAIGQTPTLTYNGMTLKEGTDYQLSYSGNTNAGTATMNIRGLGNFATYTGPYPILYGYVYRPVSFTINPAQLADVVATFGSYTYNGSAQKPTPTVTFNGAALAAGTDYTIAYPSDCTNAGTKQVTLTARSSNFTGSKAAQYTIGKRSATITANSKSKAYDGTALTGTAAGYTTSGFAKTTDLLSVTMGGSITNVGSATCSISSYALANASNYSITKQNGTLRVTAASLSSASVTLSPTSQTYTGRALMPSSVTVRVGSRTLSYGTDYTVSYKNNVAIGTATVTVTGKGNYTGTKSATFAIAKPVLETYAGSSRHDTAQKIASATASSLSSVRGIIVVACDGDKFPDALSAAGLSGALNYPVVAVNGQSLTAADRTALGAMQKKCSSGSLDILIAGGTSAVSSGVQSALSQYGKVSRPFAGANRYDTNRLIYEYGAKYGTWGTGQAFLASGLTFPDALTIAPYLTYAKVPIVLVDPSASSLSSAQCKMVANASQVVALGGTTAVPDRLLSAARQASGGKSSNRLGGSTRYATSALIVEWELSHGMTLEGAGVATGNAFPDALASSYLLGSKNSVLMLADPSGGNSGMVSAVKTAVSSKGSPAMLRVFGGTGAVPSSIRSQFATAAGWPSYTTSAK